MIKGWNLHEVEEFLIESLALPLLILLGPNSIKIEGVSLPQFKCLSHDN